MNDERNATAAWAHDMSNQRIRNLEALLAERTQALEQLQEALHVRDTQLTAVTADRDNYRAKFRDLEHELQLERGQVAAMQERAEAAEAKLALMDEYGKAQWHSGASGTEFEAGPCETFAEWLTQREEPLRPRR